MSRVTHWHVHSASVVPAAIGGVRVVATWMVASLPPPSATTTARAWSGARVAPHRPRDEIVADLHLGQNLEAVALIERNVADVARLKVSAQTLTVAVIEHVGHERRTKTTAL